MRQRFLAIAAAFAFLACNATAPSGSAPGATSAPQAAPSGGVATGAAPTQAATPGGTPDRVTGWQRDLASLVPGMERLHKDLYHSVSREALEALA